MMSFVAAAMEAEIQKTLTPEELKARIEHFRELEKISESKQTLWQFLGL
jgi:hypothetical protein